MNVRVLPCGEAAVLIEVDTLDAVLALDAAIRAELGSSEWAAHVVDVVPAARTVLVGTSGPGDLDALVAWLVECAQGCVATRVPPPDDVVTLPVRYDGPDLGEVARLTGLTVDEVVAAHTGRVWRVGFGGFTPGFAYLVGGDARLTVPRRAEPRTRLPGGSVGLAGEYSGVYPQESPGGWQIIGHTDALLWDADRTPPALLHPGVGVSFVAVEGA